MLEPHFKKKILIIEPQPYARNLLRQMLRALGFEALAFSDNAPDAARQLNLDPPALLICSDNLGQADALDLALRIRRSDLDCDRELPMLFLTAHPTEANILAVRDAGVDEIGLKPLSPATLGLKLRALFEERRVFVDCGTYVGPDRRQNRAANYDGPPRRETDPAGPLESTG